MSRELAKQPFHERIAEQLIEQLREGRAPWQKPWGTDGVDFLPTNAATGKRYKGVNAIVLMAQDRADQRWLTYKQAESMDAQVRKGERGTGIIYWKFEDEQTLKDAQGKPIKNAVGETMKITVELERPRAFFATVFNGEQIDGLPPLTPKQSRPFDQHARAEAIMANSGVKITEAPGNRAYYQPNDDAIRLPRRDQFTSEAGFYATALHELGHATGHSTRLDRDLGGAFGSRSYAKEELRAEIASMIVGNDLGTGHDPSQHVAYVASWIEVLTEQPLEIMRACADAEKIRDYVLGWEHQQSVVIGAPITAAAELDEITAELTAQSAVSNAGYDPLESWQTLQAAAVNAGLVASIKRGSEDDNENGIVPPYRITYATSEGASTTIKTDLYNDGKALTMVQGDRVPGTCFTSDSDWQSAALANAAATEASAIKDRIAEIENIEYQRLSIAAARSENAQGIGASDGQCRFIANAIAKSDIADTELFGKTLAAEIELTSDMAAAAVSAINRRPSSPIVSAQTAPAPEATPPAIDENTLVYLTAYETAYGDGLEQSGQGQAATDYAEAVAGTHDRLDVYPTAPIVRSTFSEDTWAIIANRCTGGERDVRASPEVVAKFMQDRAHDFGLPIISGERNYIDAPYAERREVKALGGEWDADRKSWFIPPGGNLRLFEKWEQPAPLAPVREGLLASSVSEKTYLAVPYAERDEAKALGAKWDRVAKSWFAPVGSPIGLVSRYSADKPDRQQAATDPREEFKDALKAIGCIVSGEHPIMDGQRHRIEAEGDKKKERSGFYIGHLDGLPAGYMVNNRTGKGGDWKSTGYRLSDEQRAQLNAEAATKLQERQTERDTKTEAIAQRVTDELATLRPVTTPTPYMAAKGIEALPGVFTDTSGTRTFVPAYDVAGKHWTTQTIAADGTKLFAKDSRKEGCFHVIGGQKALADAPAIVIAEGYSTASTLATALGFPTVAAFDAGNLKAVAVSLAAAHPDKPLIVAGDDDYRLTLKPPFENRGAVAAEQAATASGGTHILPVLHQNDRERGLSDFNDLDTRVEDTTRGAKRQIEPHVRYQISQASASVERKVASIDEIADNRQQEREPRAVRIRG